MVMRPVIGITAAHCTEELETYPRHYYVEGVKRAGGIPLILPPVRKPEEAAELLSLIHGLLLSGGGDISPVYLREEPQRGMGNCLPERDFSELLLTQLALLQDLPILAICRGLQVLAVAAEGEIYQDIYNQYPGAMQHSQTAPRQYPWHDVNIVEGSVLSRLFNKKKISVNSLHHQAVSAIPRGFIHCAVASDGIIEGIEKKDAKFCLGVQWHPESMLETEAHSIVLFKGFIEECAKQLNK